MHAHSHLLSLTHLPSVLESSGLRTEAAAQALSAPGLHHSSCLPAAHPGPQRHLTSAHAHFYQRPCSAFWFRVVSALLPVRSGGLGQRLHRGPQRHPSDSSQHAVRLVRKYSSEPPGIEAHAEVRKRVWAGRTRTRTRGRHYTSEEESGVPAPGLQFPSLPGFCSGWLSGWETCVGRAPECPRCPPVESWEEVGAAQGVWSKVCGHMRPGEGRTARNTAV